MIQMKMKMTKQCYDDHKLTMATWWLRPWINMMIHQQIQLISWSRLQHTWQR
jgi:hypothetical protein